MAFIRMCCRALVFTATCSQVQHITNDDRMRLHYNVIQCRRNLVDADMVRKPVDAAASNFFKNTLRRYGREAQKVWGVAVAGLTCAQPNRWRSDFCQSLFPPAEQLKKSF